MTTAIRLPAEVATNVCARWPERGHTWARHVVDEFDELCKRYDATATHLLSARFGFVAAVETPHGPLIMKSTPDPGAPVQAAFAHRFAELGTGPAVHEIRDTCAGTWTVMDRIVPGHTLASAHPSAELYERLVSLL